MAARFFGQFLLERGAIDAQGLLGAIEHQKKQNLKLGELAVREKLLSEADAELINVEQRRTDAKFGEIATRLGKLSAAQVETLFALQKASHVFIGEALVAVGAIAREPLAQHLEAYNREQAEERIKVDQSKSAVSWAQGPTYPTFVQLTSRLLLRVAKIGSKEGMVRELARTLSAAPVQVRIPVTGGWKGDYILRLAEPIARQIASTMLDEKEPSPAMTVDAVKEFANTLCGQACAALAQSGISCDLEAPVDVPAGQSLDLGERRIVLFSLDAAEGMVEVALSPA